MLHQQRRLQRQRHPVDQVAGAVLEFRAIAQIVHEPRRVAVERRIAALG